MSKVKTEKFNKISITDYTHIMNAIKELRDFTVYHDGTYDEDGYSDLNDYIEYPLDNDPNLNLIEGILSNAAKGNHTFWLSHMTDGFKHLTDREQLLGWLYYMESFNHQATMVQREVDKIITERLNKHGDEYSEEYNLAPKIVVDSEQEQALTELISLVKQWD